MELEIQTRFLPRLPFSCNSLISDKIWRKMSLSLSIFLVLPQISLVKYYETIKILMQIFVYFKFHFDNDACTWEKIVLRCFLEHKLIYLCAKFQLSQTPATGFLPIDITFFANIGLEYFSNNFLRVFHQSQLELPDLDQNWAKTSPLLLQIFESSNCVDRRIVHCTSYNEVRWMLWKGNELYSVHPLFKLEPMQHFK